MTMREIRVSQLVQNAPRVVYETIVLRVLPQLDLPNVVTDDNEMVAGGGYFSDLGMGTLTVRCTDAPAGTIVEAEYMFLAPGELRFRMSRSRLERQLQALVEEIRRMAQE